MPLLRIVIVGLVIMACQPARGGDWPQILGPERTGSAAADERLADRWPEAGPPVRWRKEVGAGYAGLAVVGDRAVLFHRRGDLEIVEAVDVTTGRSLWTADEPTTFQPQVGGGDGPLCVPLIHAGSVFTFGAQGVLACRDLATGKTTWSRRTHREFAAAEGYFGAGSTPLVVGDLVVVNVGGRADAGIVAFDRRTGATVWQRTAEAASYSAPVAVDVAGRPHVLAVTRAACLLLEASRGDVCWQFPFGKRGPTVNAATPLVLPDGRLFVTAAYGVGGVCAAFDATAVRPQWQGEEPLATQYCTPILVAGHLYAIDGRDDVPPADFKCLDSATGRVLWVERDFGYGTLVEAAGKLIATKTDGELVLVEPDAAKLKTLARSRPFGPELTGALRALPALAAGRLYLRDDRRLLCLQVGP